MPGWADSVIWWHCYPLRFVDAEGTAIDHVEHRLGRLAAWLDYVITLGANGMLLAPVFASRGHGYDTLDHFRIDPRLGDDADFDALVAEAHRRGVRLLLDGVFNHVSEDHEIVRRARAVGPGSDAGAWIRWVGEYPRGFEGNLDLVELDLSHPPVQDYVVEVMSHWLDRGIDGWRLDAAYAQGPDVWRPILDRVRAAHPDAWFLAEVIHGDYADFAARSGVDSVTQYELWKAVWSSLNDHNLHELAWTLTRHARFAETFRPLVFVGNHDTTRIASRLSDPRHLPLAAALLLLVPGVPAIYAGDEQGFTGEKTDGPSGDDAVRPPFPDTPAGLAPFGEPTFHAHQRLIHLRRTHPWLTSARLRVGEVTNETIAIDLAGDAGELTLALNLTDAPAEVPGVHGPLRVDAHDWALG
ncbi:MAG TPA: alpha-amylase family glycosyl hydrolase [Propionibacteriaceae bacterium]|nr:alpha-amylase family glycosyl hydrolase [Propionibacteriaceae bacterium]